LLGLVTGHVLRQLLQEPITNACTRREVRGGGGWCCISCLSPHAYVLRASSAASVRVTSSDSSTERRTCTCVRAGARQRGGTGGAGDMCGKSRVHSGGECLPCTRDAPPCGDAWSTAAARTRAARWETPSAPASALGAAPLALRPCWCWSPSPHVVVMVVFSP
jgi:hypothetical protein